MSSTTLRPAPHDPQAASKLTTHLIESFDSEAKKSAYNAHVAKLHEKAGEPFEPIQIPPPPPELYQPRPEPGFGPQHGKSAAVIMAQSAAPPGNNFNQGRMSHPQHQQQNGARGQQQQGQHYASGSSYSAQSYTYHGPEQAPASPPLVSVTDLPPEQLRHIEGMVYAAPVRNSNMRVQESQPKVPNAMSFQATANAPMFISQYSAQTLNRLQQRLAMKLGPEYISQRTGGGRGKLSYLEGWKGESSG